MRIWDWDQLLGKPGGARINWGITNTLAYTSFSGEKQKANEETGCFQVDTAVLFLVMLLPGIWMTNKRLMVVTSETTSTTTTTHITKTERRHFRDEDWEANHHHWRCGHWPWPGITDCTQNQSCKPLGKTRVCMAFPLLTHWFVSARGQFQSRTDVEHLIKTLAERSSHNKAIWISTTKLILHEAMIQLQKEQHFYFSHHVSVFSSTCRFITNNRNRDLM